MMNYLLVAIVGFLAGMLITLFMARCLVGKRSRTAAAKAKEFTQFMILSDNTILWYMCVAYTALAAYSIYKNFTGSLPWLTGGLGLAFAAWATIQSFLIRKSEKQNSKGGITYDMAMRQEEQKSVEQTQVETLNRDC